MPLLRKAQQGGSYPILAEFYDDDGVIHDDGDVTAVTWTLINRDNEVINSREDVAASAVASQTITLSGDDLQIEDETKDEEIRYLVATATISGVPVIVQEDFYVVNIRTEA